MSASSDRAVISSGTLLGCGLGGFVDGIVFHQLLQVHNMLSARYPTKGVSAEAAVVNLEINMFWDGLFHAAVWVMTAVGLGLLWRAACRAEVLPPTRVFVGSLAAGWGVFNLVEGVIDHHLLHIHHVTETGDHLIFDVTFLMSGLALILLGVGLVRSGRR